MKKVNFIIKKLNQTNVKKELKQENDLDQHINKLNLNLKKFDSKKIN